MTNTEDLMAQREAMQKKVLEIIGSRPYSHVTKEKLEALETKLNTPYQGGVVWYRGPIDCNKKNFRA